MALIVNLKPAQKEKKKKKKLTFIQWQAEEFEYLAKSKNWAYISAVIAFFLLAISLYMRNWLFVFFIIIGYFTLIVYAYKKPRKINFSISPQGISADRRLYDYENLKSFWIFYQPPVIKELSLRSRKKIMPYIRIPLENQNPIKIRTVLMKYLPEKKHKESLIDNLSRAIRY